MDQEYGASKEELLQMRTIYLVWLKDSSVISQISAQQKAVLAKLPIRPENC